MIPLDAEWRDHAACKNTDPAMFYAEGTPPAEAVELCRGCPSKGPCLDHALAYGEYGLWAGTTWKDRQRMGAAKPIPVELPTVIKHGTNSGYQTHRNRKEPVCPACRQARRRYMQRYRAKGAA